MLDYLVIGIVGLVIQIMFIKHEHEENYKEAVVLKGTASLLFVILGIIGYIKNPTSDGLLVVIGLVFGMLGDILLNLRFVFKEKEQKIFLTGIAAFLIGHFIFLAKLVPYVKHMTLCLIGGGLFAAGLLTYIFITLKPKKAFKIFGIVYLSTIIIMTAMAFDVMFVTSWDADVLYAFGALLFMCSDIVMIFNTFSKEFIFSRRITNLILYYIGQVLIALSIFII